jgi:hypothetical protein
MAESNTELNAVAPTAELPVGVHFDFDGALELARRLIELAQVWGAALEQRRVAAEAALATWTGPAGSDFGVRVASETHDGRVVCRAMRDEAHRWAQAWAEALDDGNHHRWLAARANGWEAAQPVPVPVPRPPSYEASEVQARWQP